MRKNLKVDGKKLLLLLPEANKNVFLSPTAKQLVQFLQFYSSQNSRIQKPQFHVAISCKGHEMSEQQLLDFAHRYLQEMGYAEPGQPWLIYAHHDTDIIRSNGEEL